MHERLSTAATSGVKRVCSSSDWPAAVCGLTRSGRTNCTPTKSSSRSAATTFKALRMTLPPLETFEPCDGADGGHPEPEIEAERQLDSRDVAFKFARCVTRSSAGLVGRLGQAE